VPQAGALAAREPAAAAGLMAWHITSTLEWTVPGIADNLHQLPAFSDLHVPRDWRTSGALSSGTDIQEKQTPLKKQHRTRRA